MSQERLQPPEKKSRKNELSPVEQRPQGLNRSTVLAHSIELILTNVLSQKTACIVFISKQTKLPIQYIYSFLVFKQLVDCFYERKQKVN